jgi:hypothetical protein
MTGSKTILSGADFSPSSDIKYSKLKVDARGGKSVGILNSGSNSATYISTPLMLTWGINEHVDEKSGRVTYDMALQFPSEEYAKPETTNFLNNMIEFENRIKADAIANSKDWFGKAKMSEDTVDALWTPMLKYPKNKDTGEHDYNRSPTLMVKVPFWEGEWKTELYDVNQKAIFPDPDGGLQTPKDMIVKGSHVALVVLCGGLWFVNGKFGVTWKLFQGIVKPKATMRGTCHVFITPEDKEKLLKQNVDEVEDEEDDNEINTTVEDSDAEDDVKATVTQAVESAASVTTSPEPAKKKIVKKIVKKN